MKLPPIPPGTILLNSGLKEIGTIHNPFLTEMYQFVWYNGRPTWIFNIFANFGMKILFSHTERPNFLEPTHRMTPPFLTKSYTERLFFHTVLW